MCCIHSFSPLMEKIRGVSSISNIDVNLNQHTWVASLKVGLEGSLLKLDPN